MHGPCRASRHSHPVPLPDRRNFLGWTLSHAKCLGPEMLRKKLYRVSPQDSSTTSAGRARMPAQRPKRYPAAALLHLGTPSHFQISKYVEPEKKRDPWPDISWGRTSPLSLTSEADKTAGSSTSASLHHTHALHNKRQIANSHCISQPPGSAPPCFPAPETR